ncbi:MAG: hypothetical protein NTW69_01165 [Chloroflexi bacterium]|nr:hypothetical protein [Chloroflexota bacterium]
MHNHTKSDHNRASIALYYIIALNTKLKFKNTITRVEAAKVLAGILNINQRAPESWMRGNFRKHPISRENFLRFVRIYRTKPGLESAREVGALAIDLYGSDYEKAIELLDPVDRVIETTQIMPLVKVNLAAAICNLIESSSPEELKKILLTMMSSIGGLPVIPLVEIV